VILAACAFLLTGCITDQQVRSIVNESNYEMLVATTPGLGTGLATDPSRGGGTDVDSAARISAFLAANSDDPVLSGTLRLRQILIYLNQRAFALADSAFAELDASALHTSRDQTLAAAYPDLRWWAEHSHAAEIAFSSTQTQAALTHMASLERHAADPKLAGAPDLRDYLLEMRAWIGLKLGLATPNNPTFTVDTIQKSVNAWTDTFSAAELAQLDSDFSSTNPFDLSTRRVIRARNLLSALASARRVPAGVSLPPPPPLTFSQPAVNDHFATLSR
jgi:hypothetical protein